MKSIAINGSLRKSVGKKESKKLRHNGIVPCILYGGTEQLHFSVPELELRKLVYSKDVYTVNLTLDDKTNHAVMKDIQFHPVTDKILHIDFLELFPEKSVIIDIPVVISGNAPGVKQGGQLLTKMRKLKIKALPVNLPDTIEVNIDSLNIGDTVRVGDLKLEGVEILDAPNNVITAVQTARKAEVIEVAATVSTEKKPEEEAEVSKEAEAK